MPTRNVGIVAVILEGMIALHATAAVVICTVEDFGPASLEEGKNAMHRARGYSIGLYREVGIP